MPRHPKPAPLRSNRERVDVGPVSIAPPIAEGPPAPAGLLKATGAAWAAFWTSPIARLVQPDVDGVALTRLFTLYDERERAYRGARRERLVKGSQGQPRANPLFDVVRQLDGEIRQLEDRFGMSPRARLVLGVAFVDGTTLDDLNEVLEGDDPVDDPSAADVDVDIADAPDPRLLVLDRNAG